MRTVPRLNKCSYLLPIDLIERPIEVPGNGMLSSFIGDIVASNISNPAREVSQHVLMDALARSPVYLGQSAVIGPDNGVLSTFVGNIVARYSDNGIAEAGQHILRDCVRKSVVYR